MQSSLFQLLVTKTIMLTLLDLHSGLICQNCILVLGDGKGGRNGAFAFHEHRKKKKKRYKIHLCFHSLFQPSPFSVHKDAAWNLANPRAWPWQPAHNANGIGKVANCRWCRPASSGEEVEPQGWILAALAALDTRSWSPHQHRAPPCAGVTKKQQRCRGRTPAKLIPGYCL